MATGHVFLPGFRAMPGFHLVRVGALGHVGRFVPRGAQERYERQTWVIVRTARGLETGEVLATPGGDSILVEGDGVIVRSMTIEDRLLVVRLEKNRQEAFQACCALLAERNLRATLMDVEHLFDGQSLYFYFLGEVSSEVKALTAELAEAYEATVQFRKFTKTLIEGCGPACGTDAAGERGCDSCQSGCAIAAACGSGRIAG